MSDVPSDCESDNDRREVADDARLGVSSADNGRDGGIDPTASEVAGDADRTRVDRNDGEEVFEPEPNSAAVEPGSPDLENAVFVLLGAIAMVIVLFQLASLGVGG